MSNKNEIKKKKELLQGYKDQLDHINQTCSVKGQKEYIEKRIKELENELDDSIHIEPVAQKSKDGKKTNYHYKPTTVDGENYKIRLPEQAKRYTHAYSKIDARRLFINEFRKHVHEDFNISIQDIYPVYKDQIMYGGE